MPIVEFQFRKQAFLDFFKTELNRRPLPFPTLDYFLLPELKGHLLEQVECLACTVEPSAGDGHITVEVQLAIHYHTSLVTIQQAGSLQRAVTQQRIISLPVVISVELVPRPNGVAEPQLRWGDAYNFFPASVVPLRLPQGINFQAAAIEASEDVVAVRLGTDIADRVRAPIVVQLDGNDWSQLVAGQLISEQVTARLADAFSAPLPAPLEVSEHPSGAWIPIRIPLSPWNPPFVLAHAEVTAVDVCVFNIDVSCSLTMVAEFEVSGKSQITTITLSWDLDTTLCDIALTLGWTPFMGIAFHVVAEDKLSEAMVGGLTVPAPFHKINETDHSVSYRSSSLINGPSANFLPTHAEFNAEGFLVSGSIQNNRLPLGLQGFVSTPTSTLSVDCSTRSVSVDFVPAQLFLHDIGMVRPKLFSPGILFKPADAWVALPRDNFEELELTFLDPPGGRLPAGTATSVFVHTDCGVRWVDLGVIPPDHAPPTTDDYVQMISQCMAIQDPWGDGVMNLDWLIDPPDLLREFDPIRQWTFGVRELSEGTHLEFVAVALDGTERVIGAINRRQNIAAQITTTADETLQVRMVPRGAAAAPMVFQRWIIPVASITLSESPIAVSASGGMVGLRTSDGETDIIQIDSAGVAKMERLNPQLLSNASVQHVLTHLTREERRNRKPWASVASLNRETVAVVHGTELVIGTAGPMRKM